MSSAGRSLAECGVRIATGVVTGADTIFLVRKVELINERETLVRVRSGDRFSSSQRCYARLFETGMFVGMVFRLPGRGASRRRMSLASN